jgi:myotubularin-related protein 3/4
MEFDEKLWRISASNNNHKLCPTYPESVIVPLQITDEQIQKVAAFRTSRRFPTVVWHNKHNGCVIARSSQPSVGLLAWRECADETLIKSIATNCYAMHADPTQQQQQVQHTTTSQDTCASNGNILLIVDARCRSAALANRVKGGGYEYSEYYTNCEIQFMNLENIHVIRNSYMALRQLCQQITDNKTFLSQLENTKWLFHLSGIIKAARTVVYTVDRQARPVLIHCSDGWDRTPQILALAKLLLDPFYRTKAGFQTLVETDWLMFGHKFAQRNGHAINHADLNERCPVFLQWLDCVYQLVKQYPCAFEFNELFLLKLCIHSYSCLFGTFLCDSYEERISEHVNERTFSIWSYLNNPNNKQFINYLYDETTTSVLYPSCELVCLQVWYKLYCDTEVQFLTNFDVNTKPSIVSSPALPPALQPHATPATHVVDAGPQTINENQVTCQVTIDHGATTTTTTTTTSTMPMSLQRSQPVAIQKTRSFSDFSKCSSFIGGKWLF